MISMSTGDVRSDSSDSSEKNNRESQTFQTDSESKVRFEKSEPKDQRLVESNETEELRKEIDTERKKSSDLSKRILYLQSDYINLQRQNERRIMEVRDETKLHYLEEMISVKEDLERALSIGKGSNPSVLMEGLRVLLSRIEGNLRMDDIEMINASPGVPFDIKFHEAVAYSEGNHEKDGTILSVISNGYTMRGKVVKPVLVEVARKNRAVEPCMEDEPVNNRDPETVRKGSETTKSDEGITTTKESKETRKED
jgi:molecular chaperone GrpE